MTAKEGVCGASWKETYGQDARAASIVAHRCARQAGHPPGHICGECGAAWNA